jgi:hypothetical protein
VVDRLYGLCHFLGLKNNKNTQVEGNKIACHWYEPGRLDCHMARQSSIWRRSQSKGI